jgi:succinate dehydrogenase/fumarate reductase flavoprotein subunit
VIVVAGAGMAGLCAGARLAQLGVEARVLEKGDRPGGSMRLSSGFVWRYRTYELYREQCPDGEPALQLLLQERLDAALDWLEELGAPVKASETGNPLTAGRAFDPEGLTQALVAAIGGIELGAPLPREQTPLVLATGGFGGSRPLVEAHIHPAGRLPVRANPWSTGDGLTLALGRGAAFRGPAEEFYGRALPAVDAIDPDRFVGAAQLYGRFAHVVDLDGVPLGISPSWSELDLVQAIARRREGRAWYVVDGAVLGHRVRERTVADMVAAAVEVGAPVRRGRTRDELAAALGFALDGSQLARPPFAAVQVEASITHTIGGLAIDTEARVLDTHGEPIPGLWAAGVDAGGFSGGGYASGLAQALVTGLAAAESAARSYAGSV